MKKIRDQIKSRRKELGLKQKDMMLCIGMSRQQYQRLESKGNPRLDTLDMVAKGLRMEVMLIPQEKLFEVRNILREKTDTDSEIGTDPTVTITDETAPYDPWEGLLEE